ncbi:hypothetical protein BGX20_005655, partial [Mortierella sp. AD010]
AGMINCWGQCGADTSTLWRFVKADPPDTYLILSKKGKYLTRRKSGVVYLCNNAKKRSYWEVLRTQTSREPRFSIKALGRYLQCTNTGFIVANSKTSDKWEWWTITTEQSGQLTGPSGRKSAICIGSLPLIAAGIAGAAVVAVHGGIAFAAVQGLSAAVGGFANVAQIAGQLTSSDDQKNATPKCDRYDSPQHNKTIHGEVRLIRQD